MGLDGSVFAGKITISRKATGTIDSSTMPLVATYPAAGRAKIGGT